MPQIPYLSAADQVSAGDLFAMYIQNNGDARKVAMSVVQAYLQANLEFQAGIQEYTTQYAVPSATAFSVSINSGATPNNDNVHLILTPTGPFAAGTIVLPTSGVSGVAVDKQQVLVNTTQAVTALTINGNGAAAVTGAPTTLAANAFFTLKYDQPTSTWYRVG